ncbi:Heterokaryon incompatibility protein (HET) domain containing protein [Rhypophila decipiens]
MDHPTSSAHEDDDISFAYVRLANAGDIRLIRLDPVSLVSADGFEMKTFNLGSTPEYYALSYCWGSSDRSDLVRCNGRRLSLTPHLRHGLLDIMAAHHLRTWFWIDQLCINQDDVDEQSAQVRIMTRIYGSAVTTVVWLSSSLPHNLSGTSDAGDIPADDNYGAAMDFAKDIFDTGHRDPRLSFRFASLTSGDGADSCPWPGLSRCPPTCEGTACRPSMFSKPWFSRIWVIREVFASRQEPFVVGPGDRCDGFLPLAWAGYFMSQNFRLLREARNVRDPPGGLDVTEARLSHARLLLQLAIAKMPWTLEGIMWRTASYEATKPVDKLFALLGLHGIEDGMHSFYGSLIMSNDDRIPVGLSPDYTRSLVDVARDFTRHMVEHSHNLLILSLINHDALSIARCPDEQPSWAYIPTASEEESAFLKFGFVRTDVPKYHDGFSSIRIGHHVGTYSSPIIYASQQSSILKLGGTVVARIWSVAPAEVETCKIWSWIQFAYQSCLVLFHSTGNEGAATTGSMTTDRFEVFLNRFFQSIAAGDDFRDGRNGAASPADFCAWLSLISFPESGVAPLIMASASEWVRELGGPDALTLEGVNPGHVDRWEAVYATGAGRHRHFAVLSLDDGEMIVGPRAMAASDIVCLLDGGQLAYVLRPHGEHHFKFLG